MKDHRLAGRVAALLVCTHRSKLSNFFSGDTSTEVSEEWSEPHLSSTREGRRNAR